MNDIRSIPAGEFNIKLAEALKEVDSFKKPEWVDFVKTGAAKQRPNVEPDFWYKRAASILRQLYIHGIVGVGRLRTRYGSKKNKGFKPAKFYKSGGKIVRTLLQQAEHAGFVEKAKGKRAGRQLTKDGKEFLEAIK